MNIEEMQDRCKKVKNITQDDIWALSPIYCLLDFHKDDFCKLVDAIGLEKWVEKAAYWKRLEEAEQELLQKERYLKAKSQLEDIKTQEQQLQQIVDRYESVQQDILK